MGKASNKKKQSVWLASSHVLTRACPTCHAKLDGATGMSLGDHKPAIKPVPKPGDITICAYCTTILVVTKEGFTQATEEEIQKLNPVFRKIFETFKQQRLQ